MAVEDRSKLNSGKLGDLIQNSKRLNNRKSYQSPGNKKHSELLSLQEPLPQKDNSGKQVLVSLSIKKKLKNVYLLTVDRIRAITR